MLGIARMEEVVSSRYGHGQSADSPYVALISEHEYDESDLIPLLGFTLGGRRIVVPRRVRLTTDALRSLAIGRNIMGPIVIDLEES
jgi:hypothetical protein